MNTFIRKLYNTLNKYCANFTQANSVNLNLNIWFYHKSLAVEPKTLQKLKPSPPDGQVLSVVTVSQVWLITSNVFVRQGGWEDFIYLLFYDFIYFLVLLLADERCWTFILRVVVVLNVRSIVFCRSLGPVLRSISNKILYTVGCQDRMFIGDFNNTETIFEPTCLILLLIATAARRFFMDHSWSPVVVYRTSTEHVGPAECTVVNRHKRSNVFKKSCCILLVTASWWQYIRFPGKRNFVQNYCTVLLFEHLL